MKKMLKFLFFVTVVALVAGVLGYQKFFLADYNISSRGKSISEVFEGTISVLGSENSIVIQPGSNVEWITLGGRANRVKIEPGAIVGRIQGVGRDNSIIAPTDMKVDTSRLKGTNNQLRGDNSKSLDGF